MNPNPLPTAGGARSPLTHRQRPRSIQQVMASPLPARLGPSGNLAGIGLMVFSTACMAGMYVAIRKVPGEMHPYELAFFRNLIGFLLMVGWHWRRLPLLFRTAHLKLHALRGVLNVVAMLMFFSAVLITPLAEVAALGFTAPLFASLLAVLVLREGWVAHRFAAIVFGFLGALIILRPGVAAIHPGSLLLLGSASLWAITMMVIKMLARHDSSQTITVYMVTVMAPISGLAAAFFWQWPDAEQLSWLLLIAILGTGGQMSLSQAFRLAEVSAVLPLDFFKLVWGALLGFFIFAETPDLWTLAGGMIIFASTTYLTLREARPASPKESAPRPAGSDAQTPVPSNRDRGEIKPVEEA